MRRNARIGEIETCFRGATIERAGVARERSSRVRSKCVKVRAQSTMGCAVGRSLTADRVPAVSA